MPAELQTVLDFLEELALNNNRDWFQEHKKQFQQAQAAFEDFVTDILGRFGDIEDLGAAPAKDYIYRIYRDVRFSKDKLPYKTNFGAYFAQGGRKGLGRGYYLNVQPGGCFLAGGEYMPDGDKLMRIRQVLAVHHNRLREVLAAPDFRQYFGAMTGETLKKAPKGYEADHPAIDLIRHKQFLAMHPLDDARLLADDAADHVVRVFAAMKPFVAFFADIA
jgi:uncharacterized protein (TIGR02453 family)